MNILKIILEILVNVILGFFLLASFINIDLIGPFQILILSVIIMNAYLINKKVLRRNDCKIDYKPIVVGIGISFVYFIFLNIIKKIFSK